MKALAIMLTAAAIRQPRLLFTLFVEVKPRLASERGFGGRLLQCCGFLRNGGPGGVHCSRTHQIMEPLHVERPELLPRFAFCRLHMRVDFLGTVRFGNSYIERTERATAFKR